MPDIVGQDTIVEGDLPEQVANYTSLAAHAAKTQEDWEDELVGAENNRWGSGVLGGLFQGLNQGKPFVAALVEAIITRVFPDFADAVENVTTAFDKLSENFNGKWRDIRNAKDAADYANAQLAVSNRTIKDLFDQDEGDLSADWDVVQFPTLAGGKIQQDGAGNAWWDGFGTAARTGRARFNAATTTIDNQVITVVMPLAVQKPPLLGAKSHLRLLGRLNNAGLNDSTLSYVYAEITNDSASIGYKVSGGDDVEAATVGTATQDGDVWDFWVGITGNDRMFKLRRNGVVILSYNDTGNASTKGSSNRYVGFEMRAASRGLLGQTSPGTIAVFSADDN